MPTPTGPTGRPRRPLAALSLALILAGTSAALAPRAGAAAPTAVTERVSVASDGTQGTDDSQRPAISADGRYVAFNTTSQLDPNDTDIFTDVYLRDRLLDSTILVSVATSGEKGNDGSWDPSLSADGRTIAFESAATNLLDGNVDGVSDTNGTTDVYVRQLDTGVTMLVSAAGSDAGNALSVSPAISADGRYVAFMSAASNLANMDNPGVYDVFRRDLTNDEIDLVSAAQDGGAVSEGPSYDPRISGDGRVIVYWSTNVLVPEDQNNAFDVYIRDLTGAPETSRAPSGEDASADSQLPSLSADGRYVAYQSHADNLLGFGKDTNNVIDIFVYDRQTTELTRVSLDADGGEADGPSELAAISADGQWVVFQTEADDIVAGANQWLVRRPREGTTPAVVVSMTDTDTPESGYNRPAVSGNGASVAFEGNHPFTSDDTNNGRDIFVRTELPTVSAVTPASIDPGGDAVLTVSGSWFAANPAVDLGAGLVVKDVVWVSASELAVTVAVDPAATPGPRVVTVTNPAGHQGSCGTCLSVTGPAEETPAPPGGEDDTGDLPGSDDDGIIPGDDDGEIPGGGDDAVTGGGDDPGSPGGHDGRTRQEQGQQPELPRTGGSSLSQVAAGLALATTGGVLRAVARRRASH